MNEALNWIHGVFMGSATGSETTTANIGEVGVVRRDPFAMLPFCGYNMADYFAHWIKIGKKLGKKAPKIFFVNWFRKDEKGKFIWPGYGENVRVLKYVIDRLEGKNGGQETVIGILPKAGDIDVKGLDVNSQAMSELIAIDKDGWRKEIKSIEEFYAKFGSRIPKELMKELANLKSRIE